MRLDVGGIAKGYAADEAIAVLARHGITRALAASSGDIVAGDPPPGEAGWKDLPRPKQAGEAGYDQWAGICLACSGAMTFRLPAQPPREPGGAFMPHSVAKREV